MRLGAEGSADFPLLGRRSLSGLSVRDAGQRLRDDYSAALRREVHLTLELVAPPSVLGEVVRPGPIPLSGVPTLTQGLEAAGGRTDRASRTVFLLRRRGERRGVPLYEVYRIDPTAVAKEAFPDPTLQPYDIVWVPRR